MKKFLILGLVFLISACNQSSSIDCFTIAGDTIEKDAVVPFFDQIIVHQGIKLFIREASVQKVTLRSGENLIDDVEAVVNNSILELFDYNSCNFVREYGITEVIVETPNLNKIRNDSEFTIHSDGLLNFNSLLLISENYQSDFLNVGDFDLNLNSQNIEVVSNGISNFYLSGQTDFLNVFLAAGISRFNAENLLAKEVSIFHRSSNDIIVFPIDSIKGTLYSTGDLILKNSPIQNTLDARYTGKVIYRY